MEVTCEGCGKTFNKPPSAVRKGGGKFCSWGCRYDKDRIYVEVACEYCGNVMRRKLHAHINGRFVGSFASEEEAARAFDRAALAAYGEFACLNLSADQAPEESSERTLTNLQAE